MAAQAFALLGHDNPLGRYPAPVVPVGLSNARLTAVYIGELGTQLMPLPDSATYTAYDPDLLKRLTPFVPNEHRLFALSDTEVRAYPIADESTVFREMLADSEFAADQPFLRLSLAKASRDDRLIAAERTRCDRTLRHIPKLHDRWIRTETASGATSSSPAPAPDALGTSGVFLVYGDGPARFPGVNVRMDGPTAILKLLSHTDDAGAELMSRLLSLLEFGTREIVLNVESSLTLDARGLVEIQRAHDIVSKRGGVLKVVHSERSRWQQDSFGPAIEVFLSEFDCLRSFKFRQ